MNFVQNLSCLRAAQVAATFAIFALGAIAPVSFSQEGMDLPKVLSASVPFYPRIAQAAHLTGEIHLRIKTDGTKAEEIDVLSGQAMLAQAAKENVKTWVFEKHKPTEFETTFRYVILPVTCNSQCDCKSKEEDSILLRLPKEIEVKASTMTICD